MVGLLAVLLACAFGAPAAAEVPSSAVHTLETLAGSPPEALEALFRESAPGPLPSGRVAGKVVRYEAWVLSGPMAALANALWGGKVFYGNAGGWTEFEGKRRYVEAELHNVVLGIKKFRGQVYQDNSWLDGRPVWVIDYRNTSPVIGYIRDEFRHVGRGVYLGWTFDSTNGKDGRRFMLNFAVAPQK